jgi:hypothetical protein
MSELNEMSCSEFADVAAELALGVLTGRERALALAHLDQCESCRENVRQLTMTGEELLGLLPAVEPPPGFETRVMDRLGLTVPSPVPGSRAGRTRHFGRKPESRTHSGRDGKVSRTRRMLAAAAVVLAVLVSALGGWGLRAVTSSPASAPVSSAALLSADHHTVGETILYKGNPRWVYMSVNMESGSGRVICQLIGKDGHVTTAGWFRLDHGYGSWESPDPADNGPLAGVRLISADGTVLATASFSGAQSEAKT